MKWVYGSPARIRTGNVRLGNERYIPLPTGPYLIKPRLITNQTLKCIDTITAQFTAQLDLQKSVNPWFH